MRGVKIRVGERGWALMPAVAPLGQRGFHAGEVRSGLPPHRAPLQGQGQGQGQSTENSSWSGRLALSKRLSQGSARRAVQGSAGQGRAGQGRRAGYGGR